ncbi:hypothetical protein Ancab_018686 [Ancistrocladus abbreviatus]
MIYNKSNDHHHRNNSDELDVFEAARRGRVTLDTPTTMEYQLARHAANFLNSLFSQTASKEKKSSSKYLSQSAKDHNSIIEEESPGSRRKRRSSISHFGTTTTMSSSSIADSRSLHSSSSSGFRTHLPYADTPTKSNKDIRSHSDHKQVLATLSKYTINGENAESMAIIQSNDKRGTNFDWSEEKFKCNNGLLEESRDLSYGHSEKGLKKRNGEAVDDHDHDDGGGGESDSSSNLFELQLNYELGYHSSALPVHETTHVDSIRVSGTAISHGSIKNQLSCLLVASQLCCQILQLLCFLY